MPILLTDSMAEALIIGASLIGILFGLLNVILILRIKILNIDDGIMARRDDKLIKKFQSMQ